ncbi:MAG: hypothetical protein EOO61_06470 [Hymenobacter sp.]|nr:MAG: hypothetical protein EOO61_06470 [Hymenobacter sp.]
MVKLTKNELQQVLPEVRTAYRLLYFYQNRVLGMVQYIADTLGWRFAGGWSKFSNASPRDGKGTLENWAWDWLNMYHYEFHFGERTVAGQWLAVSVFLQSDTGFYDQPGADKEAPVTFAPVAVSATRLQFLIGRNLWHSDVADEFTKTNPQTCDDYVQIHGERDGQAGLLIVKSFPLEELADEVSIRARLWELVSYCQANGIPELNMALGTGL